GGNVFVQSLEDGFTFVGRKVFDNIGNVGRVQLGQTLVGNLELYSTRGIGLDEIDELPRDRTLRDLVHQSPQCRNWDYTFQQAADRASNSDVNRADLQGRRVCIRLKVKFEIVDTHDLSSEHVNHLLVKEIACQEQHSFGGISQRPNCWRGLRSKSAINRSHRCERQHPVTGGCSNDGSCNPGPILLRHESQFSYTPAAAPG